MQLPKIPGVLLLSWNGSRFITLNLREREMKHVSSIFMSFGIGILLSKSSWRRWSAVANWILLEERLCLLQRSYPVGAGVPQGTWMRPCLYHGPCPGFVWAVQEAGSAQWGKVGTNGSKEPGDGWAFSRKWEVRPQEGAVICGLSGLQQLSQLEDLWSFLIDNHSFYFCLQYMS